LKKYLVYIFVMIVAKHIFSIWIYDGWEK